MNSKVKNQIVDKYEQIIKEYFILFHDSFILKQLNYPLSSLNIGLNAIHRVFEFIYSKTHDIDNTMYYSKKAYHYYLEYIEQIQKSNMSLNLNHVDAVLFVYKKTIFDFDISASEESSTTNVNSLSTTIVLSKEDIQQLFQKMNKITHILFFWNHNAFHFYQRQVLHDKFLSRFFQSIHHIDTFLLSTMDFVQQKNIDIPFEKFEEWLNEILRRIEMNLFYSKTKKNDSVDKKQNELLLHKYYMNREQFTERFEKGSMFDFVEWFYS
jgi:hypothetical protein